MSSKAPKKLFINEDEPTDWFDAVYSNTDLSGKNVPWANMTTHPIFQKWLDQNKLIGHGKSALVVGCGLGDDAITLEQLGFKVTAFDVSKQAIALCKKRFPDSKVNFVQADLLKGLSEWKHQFEFVLEIYTIQALPPKYETTAITNISELLSPGGQLMVITAVQHQKRDFKLGPPWLLTSDYVASFEKNGLFKTHQEISKKSDFGGESHLTIFRL